MPLQIGTVFGWLTFCLKYHKLWDRSCSVTLLVITKTLSSYSNPAGLLYFMVISHLIYFFIYILKFIFKMYGDLTINLFSPQGRINQYKLREFSVSDGARCSMGPTLRSGYVWWQWRWPLCTCGRPGSHTASRSLGWHLKIRGLLELQPVHLWD